MSSRPINVIAIAVLFLVPPVSIRAQSEPWTFERIVDNSTPVPGGTGTLSEFLAPTISGETLAFVALDPARAPGVYRATHSGVTRIADRGTQVPGGTGNFAEFFHLSVYISRDDVVFAGLDSTYREGIYAGNGLTVSRLVDRNTSIPGAGTEKFARLRGYHASGDVVVFLGEDQRGPRGIYAVRRSTTGPGTWLTPEKVVDTSDPIPGGGGTFTRFEWPSTSDGRVAFVGTRADGVTGIYVVENGSITRIVDTTVAAPGGTATFALFTGTLLSGTNLLFWATDSGGRSGLYTSSVLGQNLALVADTNTPVPGGVGTFRFDEPAGTHLFASMSGNHVVFHANDGAGHSGIFTNICGTLAKIAIAGDRVLGNAVGTAVVYEGSFNGTSVGVTMRFDQDGANGIYRANFTGRCGDEAQCQVKVSKPGKLTMLGNCANIDPLARVLPTAIYLAFIEIHDPREPRVADVEKAFLAMAPEQRKRVVENVRALRAYAAAVEKAAAKINKSKGAGVIPATVRGDRAVP